MKNVQNDSDGNCVLFTLTFLQPCLFPCRISFNSITKRKIGAQRSFFCNEIGEIKKVENQKPKGV